MFFFTQHFGFMGILKISVLSSQFEKWVMPSLPVRPTWRLPAWMTLCTSSEKLSVTRTPQWRLQPLALPSGDLKTNLLVINSHYSSRSFLGNFQSSWRQSEANPITPSSPGPSVPMLSRLVMTYTLASTLRSTTLPVLRNLLRYELP